MNADYLKLAIEIVDRGMLCAGRVAHLTHYVLQAKQLPGDMAEFGCHLGYTSALISMVFEHPIYAYDSFEGLPDPSPEDAGCAAHLVRGQMAVDPEHILRAFARYKLRQPIVYKSWFKDIPPKRLPDQISFAHLDGDLYASIRDGIRLIYPRLLQGGFCVIDDYGWDNLPGVKVAVDEFLFDKPEIALPLATGNLDTFQAVIVKV